MYWIKLALMIGGGWILLSLIACLAWWRIGRALNPQTQPYRPVPETVDEVYVRWATVPPAHDPTRDGRLDDAR